MSGFSTRIRSARQAAGLTQYDIARMTNVSVQGVSAWETGRAKQISAENLFAVAKACAVDPHWLLTGEHASPLPGEYFSEIVEKLQRLDAGQQEVVRALLDQLTKA